MKIRETELRGLACRRFVRVRALDKNESVPPGAEVVPEDTPEQDWTPEEN